MRVLIFFSIGWYVFLSHISCDNKDKIIQNFTEVNALLTDSTLSNICIRTIPSNKRFNKFIFIHNGEVYTINKGVFNTNIYGNDFNEISEEEALKEFHYYSNYLKSKGIVGSCISIDSLLMIRLAGFNTENLQPVDTLKLYEKYKYIYFTKKDIRISFVHQEYYSDLFYVQPFYFYYSNK